DECGSAVSFVAVDGGQYELRLTVVGSGVTHRAPGFSYRGVDPVATMAEAVASAWASASADGLADDVERAALGLTGLPSAVQERDRLAKAVAGLLHAREAVLCGDNVTAHAGALPDRHGVVLTVGTGVRCLAV